jgi:membrane protein DedA with SNARE-associated domain
MSGSRSPREAWGAASRARRGFVLIVAMVVGCLAVAVVLNRVGGDNALSLVDPENPGRSYVAVFVLIALDAVIPVFPGETTLNAASAAAAQGTLDLWPVIVAGALGAIVGDSTLFWIARRSTRRIEPQMEKAKRNRTVATALEILHGSTPLLLVAGRFVPGMRFVINAMMGASDVPYRRFLCWSALGAVLWSAYTCLLAYAIGTALADFPLASVVISGLITTIAIIAIFLVVRRKRRRPVSVDPRRGA